MNSVTISLVVLRHQIDSFALTQASVKQLSVSSQVNNLAVSRPLRYVYNELTKWPAPSGLIAQLVDHCIGIAEVMGSNPVQA